MLLNIFWISYLVKNARYRYAYRTGIDTDPLLETVIKSAYQLEEIYDKKGEFRKVYETGKSLEAYHQLAEILSELGRRYRIGNLRIERFLSRGLIYSSSLINSKYIRGNEGRVLPPLNRRLISESVINLVDSIRTRDVARVYQAIIDLTYIIQYNHIPSSIRSVDIDDKREFATKLIKEINEIVEGSHDPLFRGRTQFFDRLRQGVKEFRDSRLNVLTIVLADFQDSFFGKNKANKQLAKYVNAWCNAWINNDGIAQYDALSSLITLAQQKLPYRDENAFLIRY